MKLLLEKEFNEELFKINHTSSKKCKDDELSTNRDENSGEFRLLKVSWKTRSLTMNILRAIYMICRSYFNSVYFYFLPFFSIMINCLVP